MEAPIEFITADENDQLEVNPKALELLRQVDKCLIPVAIVGTYRTGKSYLLNRLMEQNNGFPLGSTVQSKTKGIWMWLRDHPKDESKALLLLDTEGLDDAEKGNKGHDANIFTLAVLLCSVLIYNSKGAIDSSALDGLHLATELTNHIRVKSTKSELEDDESGNEFSVFFPSLIWAVRDHFLNLEIDGEPCTPSDYLEFCLKSKKGRSGKTALYNNLRHSIREFFPKRNCFVFPLPVELDQLEHLDQMAENELNPKFVEAGNKFCQFVFDNSQAKTVHGKDIRGSTYASLAETYVEAVLRGNICIDNAFEIVMKKENRAALEEAVADFQKKMEILNYPLEQEDYDQNSTQANKEANDLFLSKAINIDKYKSFHEELWQILEQRNNEFLKKNTQKSLEVSQEILHSLYEQKIQKILNQNEYMSVGGYDKFSKDVEDMEKQYKDSPITMGPAKTGVLVHFLKEKIGGLRNQIMQADKSMKKEKKKQEELRLIAEQIKKESKETKEKMEQVKEHNKKQEAMHEENMTKMRVDVQKAHEAEMKKMTEDVAEKNKEIERLRKEGMNEQADTMNKLVNGMLKMISYMEEARVKSDQENEEKYKQLMKKFTKDPIKTTQEKTGFKCSIS